MNAGFIKRKSVLVLLFLTLLLSGCFLGDKDSYPHDEALLVKVLSPGKYKKDSGDRSAVITVSMAPSGKYRIQSGETTYEAGIYPNGRTTYLVYVKKIDDKTYNYFLARQTEDRGLVLYDAQEAAATLLNQMIGENVSDMLIQVPFTDQKYNKLFFKRLGALDKSQFSISHTLTPTGQ
jgi:hypothetical protein